MFDTTIRKQTKITQIRHVPPLQTTGGKDEDEHRFLFGNRTGHHNTELRT